ncbi:MAG: hypothetical protein WCZ27_02780, partial [Tissierellaceae bacterium]
TYAAIYREKLQNDPFINELNIGAGDCTLDFRKLHFAIAKHNLLLTMQVLYQIGYPEPFCEPFGTNRAN